MSGPLFASFSIEAQIFYRSASVALSVNPPACRKAYSLSYGVVNLKPIVPGHVLVIPKRVVPRLKDLREDEVADLFLSVQTIGKVIEREYKGDALTIATQDGEAAGQSVPHVHVHIMPRHAGDFEPKDEIYPVLDRFKVNDEVDSPRVAPLQLDDDARKPRSVLPLLSPLRHHCRALPKLIQPDPVNLRLYGHCKARKRVSDLMEEPIPWGKALEHHLSARALHRKNSPLKALYKYTSVEGMVSFAGGMPLPAVFPFETIEADVPKPDAFSIDPKGEPSSWSWLWRLFSSRTMRISIPKYSDGQIDLARSLQYTTVQGFAVFISFVNDFVKRVHQPPIGTRHMVIATSGNTDGWNRCVTTLCNWGDAVLIEEWTYSGALATLAEFDILPISLELDDQGIVPASLDRIMSNWRPEDYDGRAKPHVMYTVPTGQNPTGVTMTLRRKQEIYALCQKHDIIICEDDPYWNLQLPAYGNTGPMAPLLPSFLHFDVDGRVVRMDTFSKSIAPGSRLGFCTMNELFAERMLRAGDTSTGAPCGFVQAFITQLVALEWKADGFLRWMDGLRAQYTARRDLLVDRLYHEFDVTADPTATVFTAFAKSDKSEKHHKERLIAFRIPTGGMFVWLQVFFETHPDFSRLLRAADADASAPSAVDILSERLFVRLAEAKVLCVPGTFFDADPLKHRHATSGFLRLSFSLASREQMHEGMAVFARVLTRFMQGM